jgi:transcriptional regulator with XRE-family HTH domain
MNEPVPLGIQLLDLRIRLGLSLHAMAELLYTSQQTYRNWEQGSKPRKEAQARIERFLVSATSHLDLLAEAGVDLGMLLPLNLASSQLGIPHETLFHTYRDGGFHAEDLGLLGVWVRRDGLGEIMEAVLA